MGNLDLPTIYDETGILLADDEPEHLDWLVDYFQSKEISATIVTDVGSAMEASAKTQFRAYIIDLNIPFGSWRPPSHPPTAAYNDYHGLYIIKAVRSQGNAGRNTIAYSAHYNESIAAEIKLLYCEYVVKGRPRELKTSIDIVLSHLPKSLISKNAP